MKRETWKDIPGYEGYYQVSNTGKVKSVKRLVKVKEHNNRSCVSYKEKILKQVLFGKPKHKYFKVMLSKGGNRKLYNVHKLVLLSFVPNPENKLQGNHIDANTKNNNLSNLEWCTQKENVAHAINLGRKNYYKEGYK